MPNFELLRVAAAIIDGIPSRVFDLDMIADQDGVSMDNAEPLKAKRCGTVACAMGWISMHPTFNALGLEVTALSAYNGRVLMHGLLMSYARAAERLFEISQDDADNLFISHGESDYDDRRSTSTSKELFKSRVRQFLAEHDQPINPKF